MAFETVPLGGLPAFIPLQAVVSRVSISKYFLRRVVLILPRLQTVLMVGWAAIRVHTHIHTFKPRSWQADWGAPIASSLTTGLGKNEREKQILIGYPLWYLDASRGGVAGGCTWLHRAMRARSRARVVCSWHNGQAQPKRVGLAVLGWRVPLSLLTSSFTIDFTHMCIP